MRAARHGFWLPGFGRSSAGGDGLSAGEEPLGSIDPAPRPYGFEGAALSCARIKGAADAHAQGRIVSVLEGGYNISALARSVEAHLQAMI